MARTATTLGEVVTLQRGFDLPASERQEGSVPVVASTGLVGHHTEAKVRGPGVVLGRSGSLGMPQYIREDFWPLNTTLWVKDFKGNDRRYVYYLLRTLGLERFNAGSGVPTLNRNHVHPLPVVVAPRLEQVAIGALLGVLDDKIELDRRVNETLEELVAALFSSRFSDVGVSGTVADLVELSRATIDPQQAPDEVFDHFSIPAFDQSRQPARELGAAIRSTKVAVPLNSLLLSKLNPRIPRIWLPDVNSERRAICSTEFLVCMPREPFDVAFLYGFFSSRSFRDEFGSLVTGTSGSHQRVKPADFLALDARLPTPDGVSSYSRAARPLLDRILHNRRESRMLAQLRDTLLPKLISGEVQLGDPEASDDTIATPSATAQGIE